jgi:hypothetical protein
MAYHLSPSLFLTIKKQLKVFGRGTASEASALILVMNLECALDENLVERERR